MKCYVCDATLTRENETEEHIILNAAGGRLKSKELICRNCNSSFGAKIDAVLAEQLNDMANMLMIKRHRGEPQPILGTLGSTQEQYSMKVGGKPELAKPVYTKSDDGSITLRARTKKELLKMLAGIARKNPTFNPDEAMKHARWEKKYLEEPLMFNVTIGGPQTFRAVCKCATNFFIHSGGDMTQIKHLIAYISGKDDKEIVWMHYQDDLYDLRADESFHLISLVGDPVDKVLYCYVDYFNTYKFLVLLNDNYEGKLIQKTYCFDLVNNKEIQRPVRIKYNRKELLKFFLNKDVNPFDRVKASVQHSINIGIKRQTDAHRKRILEDAINEAFSRFPEGVPVTQQMIDTIIPEIAERLVSALMRPPKDINRIPNVE